MSQQMMVEVPKKMPGPTPAGTGVLQRECHKCGKKVDEQKRGVLQRSAVQEGPEHIPPIVHEVLREPGRPLDAGTRAFMEPRFRHDFSQVRVHTDAKAGEAARVLNARAFTAATDLVFATGQYAPDITAGRRLLAHELAHVVQQQPKIAGRRELIPYPVSGGNTDLLRTDPGSSTTGLEVSRPGDVYEQEAGLIAERVIRTEKTDLQSERFGIDRGSISHAGIDRFSPDKNGKYRSISRATPWILQRDLALTLPGELPDQPELTDAQVQAAIRYNSASYREDSIRLIQDLVGAGQTGSFDETTVRLVAKIQSDFGLVPVDGKVGPDTYNLLIRELQAEGTTPGTCLTLFQLIGPEPLTFFRNSPTSGTIGSRFFIKARFDPRCNCGDFEYRQYIAGNVELHDVAGPVFNLNSRFAVPGGLPATLTEDGDSTIPAGNALHNYGHRSFIGNPNCDQYLPDRRTGCEYESCDFPELTPIPAAVGDTGDRYEWIMRFRGTINRKGQGVVEEKYWAIRGTIVLPHP